VKVPHRSETDDRLAQIERMIEAYRLVRHRRLMRLAMKMWRQEATTLQLAKLDAPTDLIH
jgi:hypothetical protein